MQTHYATAVVSLLALLVYMWMGIKVGQARAKTGIAAPAMTGDPLLERTVRVQANTLEWMPVFLTSLWIFALYWNDRIAALLGVVWIVGRILYALGYYAEASRRSSGFMVQFLACVVLILGGLGRLVWAIVTTGGI